VKPILIAMSGNKKTGNKENQDMGKDTVKMARGSIAKMIHATEMVNSFAEYLDAFTNNPFFTPCSNNNVSSIVKFGFELKKFIALPYNVSKIVFGDIVEIRGLNVRCSAVELWYSYTDNVDRVYTVQLNDTMIRVKDLFMLLYVMDKMDQEDLNTFITGLNSIENSIEAERRFLSDFLRSNGIETNG
jgi:hypothetical protein